MIKFVYFDLGGVTIMDFTANNRWQELEKELEIPAFAIDDFKKFWDKYEPELCLGRDVETLIPLLKKSFGINPPKGYSLLIDGFIKRFEANKSIWPIINKIHQQKKVGLLTNMYPRMFTEIKKRGLIPDIHWDIVIDSSIVKLRKPDQKIFALAQKETGVEGKEILFVENTLKNIKAAQDFGWQTYFYDSSNPAESSHQLMLLYDSLI